MHILFAISLPFPCQLICILSVVSFTHKPTELMISILFQSFQSFQLTHICVYCQQVWKIHYTEISTQLACARNYINLFIGYVCGMPYPVCYRASRCNYRVIDIMIQHELSSWFTELLPTLVIVMAIAVIGHHRRYRSTIPNWIGLYPDI